jgi:hypothetical protein
VSYRGFTNSGFTQANDDVNKTAWEKGTLDDRVTGYYTIFDKHHDQSWVNVDFDKALAFYGVTRTLGAPKSDLRGRGRHHRRLRPAGLEGHPVRQAGARQRRPARL